MMAAETQQVRAPRAVIPPDQPLAQAVCATLATGLVAMTHHQAAAIAGEVEPLHQMRVAARRLRAIVQLFAGAIHGSRVRVYKRDLPWLGHAAGAVRECDVIEALIRQCGGRLDPALAGALTPLFDTLVTERNAAHARFIAELRTRRYARMCDRLANPLLRRALPDVAAGCDAPLMIAPVAKSARKAGKRVNREAAPELFHRLRVRVKRLRYSLDMLSGMDGKRLRKALIRLEEMQELLGVHQDVVCTIAWLRSYAARAPAVPPETLMAVGAMVQALVLRRQKLAARASRRWKKIVRSGVLDDALEEISRAAEPHREAAQQAAQARASATAAADAPGNPRSSAAATAAGERPVQALPDDPVSPNSPAASQEQPLATRSSPAEAPAQSDTVETPPTLPTPTNG